MNKKHIMAAAAAALCASSVAFADIPMAYYASLDGKCGQELKTAIHNLVSTSVKMLSYGSGQDHTWWGFYVTDFKMDGTKRHRPLQQRDVLLRQPRFVCLRHEHRALLPQELVGRHVEQRL